VNVAEQTPEIVSFLKDEALETPLKQWPGPPVSLVEIARIGQAKPVWSENSAAISCSFQLGYDVHCSLISAT
jgi:hypothetical protein